MAVEITTLPEGLDIIAPYWPENLDEDVYGQTADERMQKSVTTATNAGIVDQTRQSIAASENEGQTISALDASLTLRVGRLGEFSTRYAAQATSLAMDAQNIFNTKNMLNAIAADYQAGHEALTAASISGGGTQAQIEAARAQLKQQAQMAAAMVGGGFQMAHQELTQAAANGQMLNAAPSMMPPTMPMSAGTMPGWGGVPSVTNPQLAGMPGMQGGQQMMGMQGAGSQPGSLIGHAMQMAPTLMQHVANSPIGQAIDGLGQRFEEAAAAVISGEQPEGGQPTGLGSLLPGFGQASGSGEAQLGDYRATGSFDAQGSSLTVDGDITRDGDSDGASGSGGGGRGMGGVPSSGGSGGGGSTSSVPGSVEEAVDEAVDDAEEAAADVAEAVEQARADAADDVEVEVVNEPPITDAETATTAAEESASARASIDIETPGLAAYGEAEASYGAPADAETSTTASDATTETTSDRGTATTAAPAPAPAAAPAAAPSAGGGSPMMGGMMPMGAMGAMGAMGQQAPSKGAAADAPTMSAGALQARELTDVLSAQAAAEAAEAATEATDSLLEHFDPSVADAVRVAARLFTVTGTDTQVGVGRLADGTFVYATPDMFGMPASDDPVPAGAVPLAAVMPMSSPLFFADWAGAEDPAGILLLAADAGLIGELDSVVCINRDPELPPLANTEVVPPSMVASATPTPIDNDAIATWPSIDESDVDELISMATEMWGLDDAEGVTAEDLRGLMAAQRWDQRPVDAPTAPLAASMSWLVAEARDAAKRGDTVYAAAAGFIIMNLSASIPE